MSDRSPVRSGGFRAAVRACIALLLVSAGSPASSAAARQPRERTEFSGLRAIVLTRNHDDPASLEELKLLGINAIVTGQPPSRETALAADAAGLSYIAFLSSRSVERLETDAAFLIEVSAVAAIPSFLGFHSLDEDVVEGYTSPATQERTYTSLKRIFPGRLVLHAHRLDLAILERGYLDDYFRPGFTDLVAPYFYPVGGTTLGPYSSGDPWEPLLEGLLRELKERMPPGKEVLPVLQAFEQSGYPVEEDLPERQMEFYRALWPANRNVVGFAWFDQTSDGVLIGMAALRDVQRGFRNLCLSLAEAPDPRGDRDRERGPVFGASRSSPLRLPLTRPFSGAGAR